MTHDLMCTGCLPVLPGSSFFTALGVENVCLRLKWIAGTTNLKLRELIPTSTRYLRLINPVIGAVSRLDKRRHIIEVRLKVAL